MLLRAVLGATTLVLAGPSEDPERHRAPGETVAGLQAAIVMAGEAVQSQPVPVGLELCNVANETVLVDYYSGDWSVQVWDSTGRRVWPRFIASDSLRPIRRPEPLLPGVCRSTQLDDLRLVSGLPGSSADWAYESLEIGAYSLRGEYRSPSVKFYELLQAREPDSSIPWTGTAMSGEAKLSVR